MADPEKFKLLYKDLVAGSRTKDKGCVQYDLLQSKDDPVRCARRTTPTTLRAPAPPSEC